MAATPLHVSSRLPSGKYIRPAMMKLMSEQVSKYEKANRMIDEVENKISAYSSKPPPKGKRK